MSERGRNDRAFTSTQVEFAAHIRNPTLHPAPPDIEPRRMKIYVDLFFNNIKNFLSTTFPIARDLLGPTDWPALCRAFFHQHAATSPYFAEISQEFLSFLDARRQRDDCSDPPFLLELCHYEWVELSLDLEGDDGGLIPTDREVLGRLRISTEARCLHYAYPVHRIGPEHRPKGPDPTQLIVYRRDDKVRFLETNLPTLRMLSLLDAVTGAEAVKAVAYELEAAQGASVDVEQLMAEGTAQLHQFAEMGILRCRV